MTNLIHRLEAAEGPSRELDGEIWCAANGLEFHSWDGAGVVWLENGSIRHQPSDRVKEFSASLDAAVSLMPEGIARTEMEFHEGFAEVDIIIRLPGGPIYHGEAPTPALALCSAALRAREA